MCSASAASIRLIDVTETYTLRRRVLRPRQSEPAVEFDGDRRTGALHLGAFSDGRLLAVASLLPERPPDPELPGDWRLRGMATDPEHRRLGLGRELIETALGLVAERGGVALWCNARVSAEPFYRALGFAPQGEPFELPEIGPHLRMWRAV